MTNNIQVRSSELIDWEWPVDLGGPFNTGKLVDNEGK